MRVLFDMTATGAVDGVSRWSRNVVAALAEAAPGWTLILAIDRGQVDDFGGAPNVSIVTLSGSPRIRRIAAAIGRDSYPRDLVGEVDVIVGPAFVTWSGAGIPEVPVIHDLAFHLHPRSVAPRNLVYLRMTVPRVIRRAARVLTVSNSVREEIASVYGTDPKDISVVHGGSSLRDRFDGSASVPVEGSFVLWVGALEPRKNLKGITSALRRMASRRRVPLVVVASRSWRRRSLGVDVRQEVASGRIVHLENVDDEALAALYSRASALVFPSFYEGFGLPVIEAMSFGCPVVASDIPVLREIGGDLLEYVDPRDPDSIAGGLQRVLDRGRDPAHSAALDERAARYTWQRSAEQLREAIRAAAGLSG